MEEVYFKMADAFEKNLKCALAVIVRQRGSSPRHIGTPYLVCEDGTCAGTIGGGIFEAMVTEKANTVIKNGLPSLMHFSLKGMDVQKTDMLCGGDVDVFIEPVLPTNIHHLRLYKRVTEILRKGGAGCIVKGINEELWMSRDIPLMLIEDDGNVLGTIGEDDELHVEIKKLVQESLEKGSPELYELEDSKGNHIKLFFQPIKSDPVLYVFGGGHVSTQIVPLAKKVGFKVVVIDDRDEFATPERFPDAHSVKNLPFENIMENIKVDESSYIVIVTRGHAHDRDVLAQALKTKARYIGMIGSKRKRKIIYQSLLDEGFTQDDLKRVHSPIGIDIGAETPEEIAVSIVAELILIRSGKRKGE